MLRSADPRRGRGFTLAELVIALAILAIIATLALPSFQTMIENQRLRAAAESVLNGLQLARAEAIRRNTRVRLVMNGATPGWTVELDDGTDIQVRPAGETGSGLTVALTPDGATTATFNAFGRLVGNADASASITQIDLSIAGNARPLRVQLNAAGLIRMCENSTYLPEGDPRRC
ncbi:MAG: hypothetical protein OHK0026_13540 [Rhodocyclaceae bacterium]